MELKYVGFRGSLALLAYFCKSYGLWSFEFYEYKPKICYFVS